jgi:hypothetical protein
MELFIEKDTKKGMEKDSPTLHPIFPPPLVPLPPLAPMQPQIDFSIIFSAASSSSSSQGRESKTKKGASPFLKEKNEENVWPAERAFHGVYEWDRKSRQQLFCRPVDPIADGALDYNQNNKHQMDIIHKLLLLLITRRTW